MKNRIFSDSKDFIKRSKNIHKIINDFNLNSEEISQEDIEEMQWHISMWNATALFMGYGILETPNISNLPHYFDCKFPGDKQYQVNREEMFQTSEDYIGPDLDNIRSKFIENHKIKWSPTLDFNQAKEVEAKLMKNGSYDKFEKALRSDSEYPVNVAYKNSPYNKEINGQGNNELEAICQACFNFMKRKNGEQKTLFNESEETSPLI